MLKTARQLSSDIQKIPDRKSFFARQHRGNAVSLYVLHTGAELAVNDAGSRYIGDVRTTQNLAALSFRQQRLFQRRGALTERVQLDCLQRNRLSAFGIVGF